MIISGLKFKILRFLANITFGPIKAYILEQKSSCGFINVKGKNNIFDKKKILKNKINLSIQGNNNEIKFNFSKIKGKKKRLRIRIFGNNNKIEIGDNLAINGYLNIDFAYSPLKTDYSILKIGNDFYVGSMEIMFLENNSKFIIGDKCMFSDKILARLSDTHSVIDLSGNLLNYGGSVEVGDHVWCGREVRIMKKVSIGSNSIIGASSVVTTRFKESNIAVAGNPAKIIKRDVNWSSTPPQTYLEENLKNKELVYE